MQNILVFKMKSLEDYEELKKVNSARSKTMSKFIRKILCQM
jgi:hypothetical protein